MAGPRAQQLALGFGLTLAVAVGAHAVTVGNDFVLDDSRAVLGNRCVVATPGPRCAFASDFWGRPAAEVGRSYRPLTVLSFALDWRLGGGRPWLFHLANVLLHAATALLLFLLLLRLVADTVPAAAGAALFAALAIHSDAVAAVVGRADVLAALLVIASLLAASAPDVRPPRVVAAGAAYAGALLAHELAILAPVFLVAVDRARGAPTRARAALYVAFAALTIAYLALRAVLLGHIVGPPPDPLNNPAVVAAAGGRLLLGAALTGRALALMLVPRGLSAEYGHAEIVVPSSALDGGVALGALATAALIAAWLRARRRAPLVAAGALALGASLLFISNTILLMPTAFAERLLYLPSIALALMVAGVVAATSPGWPRRALCVAVALAVLANAAVAIDHGRAWRDSLSLFASAARARPASARAHANLGLALNQRGRHAEAAAALERALAIAPDLDAAARELAIARVQLGDVARARRLFEAVYRRAPVDADTVHNYAVFLLRRREPGRAAEVLERYLRERPGDRSAAGLLARARARGRAEGGR
jgi:tetratricopeptide (TPR) repeat protein